MNGGQIGIFVCTGYGIAEALDVDALIEVVGQDPGVGLCRTIETCEGDDLAVIRQEIRAHGLTKVAIAGISPRYYQDGLSDFCVAVEKVPLRDHVVWCQPPNSEDTQMMAADYLRMAVAKLKKIAPPRPFDTGAPIEKRLLVVGGGITGMTAALEAARAGYEVRLVEKRDRLGGQLAEQHRSIPVSPPFRDLEETGVRGILSAIEAHKRIIVHTAAVTSRIEGAPGRFDVTLSRAVDGRPTTEVVDRFLAGAIVQATGWRPTEPRDLVPYGGLADVIRNVDLEEMVRETGQIRRPSDNREVRSIAFIQCAGSGDRAQRAYCSSICCLTALKQALYLRERAPDGQVFIFYEFMRTPGRYEDFYRRVQEEEGIFFLRAGVCDVQRNGDGRLLVTAESPMLPESLGVSVDLVVLAAGMAPVSADGEAIRALNDAKLAVERGESDVQRSHAGEAARALSRHQGTEILNLAYRQGPDLPVLADGFPDSHFICFPYESRRTGIYPAGTLRAPMDRLQSMEDGAGAALKAIQCIEMTSRGEAVHPRAGDVSVPDFMLQRCTLCKRCTEECPFGVLNEDDKGTPLLHPTRCRRCGICLGACPERIVSFPDYSVDMVASMIKAVDVPDEFEEKPRILAFLCENDAYPAMDLLGLYRRRYSPYVRVIPVRCLGSVNVAWIKEAISCGFDGVILVGCKYGDDYQCHYVKGSELAFSRGENIRKTLEQMSMEDDRVALHQLEISEYDKLQQIFQDFEAVVEEIGMNPFKGM